MKVGDLVKFKDRTNKSGPIGIVINLSTLSRAPHPSQPERDVAYIEWACKYTAVGNYQVSLLEVINESR